MRGSRQGESHGGVYLVDFGADRAVRVLDWNTMGIDWQGRGWDRGLRGIAFDGETVYIAASDELFAYTPDFRLIGSWRNRYLKHCHEICRHERTLFLTSTGFDSILGFDLDREDLLVGPARRGRGRRRIRRQAFDPGVRDRARLPGTELHLNNVHCAPGGMHISGLRTAGMLLFNGRELRRWVTIPVGAHNARPFRDGVLFNDTEADVVRFVSREQGARVSRCRASPEDSSPTSTRRTPGVARQAFGAWPVRDRRRAHRRGSSPSTITLHDLRPGGKPRMATLSHDVRNAIHGLEVWPYSPAAPGTAGMRGRAAAIGLSHGHRCTDPLFRQSRHGAAAAAILAQDEAAWNENVQRQRDYEVHEQTRSIVLLFAEVSRLARGRRQQAAGLGPLC